jgi:uncharacterized membrane protein YjgN (DUF898 family)
MTNTDAAPPAGASAPSLADHRFRYDGDVGSFYGIWLLNLFLNIVTLGIYNFWGRTRLRRYAASSFELSGDRLEYAGTGGELFRGFLKALPVIIVLYLPYILYPNRVYPLTNLMVIPIGYFFYVGIYAAFRYRLSRTTWRGIRGHLGGSAFKFGALKLGLTVVNILSLGFMIPWSDVKAVRYQMENLWVGDRRGEFTGEASDLWGTHIATWLLAIPTLGISRFWYAAALQRFTYGNFRIGNLRMSADQTGGQVFGLIAINLLITILTLGLGRPFVFNRDFRFIAEHLWLSGDLETEAAHIKQSLAAKPSSGEGLDGMLDTGLF